MFPPTKMQINFECQYFFSTEIHMKPVSWMRRNDYISTENTKFAPRNYEAAESKYYWFAL